MIFASLIMGSLIGLLYRFFFASMQERIGVFISQNTAHTPHRIIIETIIVSFMRILIISSLLAYLLLSNSIHLILVTLSCVVTIYFFGSIKDIIAHGKH